ncbi:MAG TPA: hypothetical protein VMS08_05010, partial [Candidatus Saccharimonadia bacterium]|nr:hypothetical protein [Candidatus Saccharimonadia bacterium]
GSVLSAVASAAAVYLGAKNRGSLEDHAIALKSVEAKVDGQLTEVIGLRDAVAFGKGEDRQRDKQEIKAAVAAGIKQANGPETGGS